MVRTLAAFLIVLPLWAQVAQTAGPRVRTAERRSGPFEISGRNFTVVLRVARLETTGAADPDFGETVSSIEIRGQSGALQYQKSFSYEIQGDRFSESLSIHAETLTGAKGTGLLLTYGYLPSAPLGGQSWQVFGLAGEKLVPFSEPFSTEGELVSPGPEDRAHTSWEPVLKADVLRFRIWTGNFFVIVPLRVDWLMARVAPAWRCWQLTPSGPKPVCQFEVEADRTPSDDLTFVRLLPEAFAEGIAAHAVVKRDSKVEFLAAEAEVIWKETPQGIEFGVSDDPWLKVRIDGKEGWIHTEEDLLAIGLPTAG